MLYRYIFWEVFVYKDSILILDDETEIIENVVYDFQEISLDVCSAQRADEALKLVEEMNFLCIITDLNLYGDDGFSFIKEVKKIEPDIPIIILTGHGEKSKFENARELGVIDFLNKPYSKEDLIYLVNDLIEESKERIAS